MGKSNLNYSELLITGTRGEQPHDIKSRCYKLCEDYLGGVWSNTSLDNVEVKRISGGLTNQLYYCAILIDGLPQKEIAIRFYGKKHFNKENVKNERFNDAIVAVYVSENKLGPKILGLFENGQIMKYYHHNRFRKDHQQDPSLVKNLAKILAKIHGLNVPIKRDKNLLNNMIDNYYKDSQQIIANNFDSDGHLFTKYNVNAEIEWIKTVIEKINSPIVFSHMDFRGSNAMIIEKRDKKKILLCDYEYSDYCYRGFDFGTAFTEWDKTLDEFWFAKKFPDDSVVIQFINYYIEESVKLHGKGFMDNENNSVQHLLIETKIFTFVVFLFAALILFKTKKEFLGTYEQRMVYVEACLQNYMFTKNKFENEINNFLNLYN